MRRIHIALIGMMGSGKTAVAKRLSRRTGLPWFDTDQEIEKNSRRKISDIFDPLHPVPFRKIETDVLLEILTREVRPIIIATGGGLPLSVKNRGILRRYCTVFYLKESVESILRNVAKNNNRPLLHVRGRVQQVKKLSREREPVYRETAHYLIHKRNRSFEAIMDQILRLRNPSSLKKT